MSNYTTLLGAEQVADAARSISAAAAEMQRAATHLEYTTERLVRAFDVHASRIEEAMNKEPT